MSTSDSPLALRASRLRTVLRCLAASAALTFTLSAQVTWVKRGPSALATDPGIRGDYGIVYDSHRDRVVLFGGNNFSGQLGETWEWNGFTWEARTLPASPSGRSGHAMFYDSTAKRVILYGGYGGGFELGDTWQYDGTTWTQLAVSGLGPRFGHAMTYDARRQRGVLYGGAAAGSIRSDVWEWTGTSWVSAPSNNAGPTRIYHGMTYDLGRGRVVAFGGVTSLSVPLNDLYEYDGVTWTSKPTGPAARSSHTFVYDLARSTTVLFGGIGTSSQYLSDTWEWNGTTWTQRFPAGTPPASARHTGAFDTARERLIFFGGEIAQNTYVNDTWQWDGTNWFQPARLNGPTARQGNAMVYDAASGGALMWGGSGASSVINETYVWVWTGSAWQLQGSTTSGPAGRSGLAMTYDAGRQRTIVFGGANGAGTRLNEHWEWWGTLSPPRWIQNFPQTLPPARAGHAMAYESFFVTVFGGMNASNVRTNDTWRFDGLTWGQLNPANRPSARDSVAMAYDPTRGKTVLFGGYDGSYRNDTWEWDGTNWTQRFPTTSPPPRAQHVMTYKEGGRVGLFGGQGPGSTFLDDLWEWDGTNWTQVTPAASPAGRASTAMTFDPVLRRYVLFGGSASGTLMRDFWEGSYPANRDIFGTGCPGITGVPLIFSPNSPRQGSNWGIGLYNARPSSAASLAIGASNTTWSGFNLPLNLGIINAPLCNVLVSYDVTLPLGTTSSGISGYFLPISTNPAFVGAPLYAQWFIADPGANGLGVVFSSGLVGRIGN